MEYFEYFPYLYWKENGKEFLAQDITIRVIFDEISIKDKTIFYNYRIQDSDTLEMIAQNFYDDYTYSWVIMLVNKIFDRDFEWPMNSYEFSQYILDKYGSVSVANQPRYFIKVGENFWTEVSYQQYLTTDPLKRKIRTSYELEHEQNEKRRNIKILKREFLADFLNKFNALVRQ